MRSVNTAHKAGRDLGREISDVWIPDELLRRQIRRSIGPRIKLLTSDEERERDAWGGAFVFMILMSLLGIGAAVLRSWQDDSAALPSVVLVAQSWLSAFPAIAVMGVAGILVVSVLIIGILWRLATERANEEYSRTMAALYRAAFDGAVAVLESRRRKVGMPIEAGQRRAYPPPSARPAGVNPREAEQVVAQWMRHLGEVDAELTSFTGDGGIDVTGSKSFAQVKHYSKPVGVAPVRELAGVAANDRHRRQALFFTSVGYAQGAVEFANNTGIALFVYDAANAGLEAMNPRAKTVMHNGIR